MLNNLEVFMRRFFFGTFLAVSLFAIVGCSSSSSADEDGVTDECLEDPMLPICQTGPDDVGPDDQGNMFEDDPDLAEQLLDVVREFENPAQ